MLLINLQISKYEKHFLPRQSKIILFTHRLKDLYSFIKKIPIEKIAIKISDVLDLSSQDCGLSTACSLVSSLPLPLRNQMGIKLGEKKVFDESGMLYYMWVIYLPNYLLFSFTTKKLWYCYVKLYHFLKFTIHNHEGRAVRKVVIKSKEEAADCMRKILRQKVMVSSARQAVAGLLTVGVVHGLRYVGSKMHKAWKSWW